MFRWLLLKKLMNLGSYGIDPSDERGSHKLRLWRFSYQGHHPVT